MPSGGLVDELLEHLDKAFDKFVEKVGDLADLAKAVGGYYFVLLAAVVFGIRSFNSNLPLILGAIERHNRSKRLHERKMEELRHAFEDRKRKPRKQQQKEP